MDKKDDDGGEEEERDEKDEIKLNSYPGKPSHRHWRCEKATVQRRCQMYKSV